MGLLTGKMAVMLRTGQIIEKLFYSGNKRITARDRSFLLTVGKHKIIRSFSYMNSKPKI